MHWTHLMERAHTIPQTAEEWFTAGSDAVGVTITLLWLSGAQQLADSMLHTGIGLVTLASVTFSLWSKVRTWRKDEKQRKKDKQ
jgi:hypothetical protein